ncbi:MAG TPA: A24 family peptidase [Urbifossiella sp.]|nr:A24 family peptidase [Urbifossiella sp.]
MPFAIAFVGILVVGLGYAAYVDWTTLKVPKWLTIGLLALGIAMNLARGGWLGRDSDDGLGLGLLNGFLFSLAGFALGFALFFLLWIFGLGGGGDVKLVAATGAWIGWLPVLLSIALSLPFLILVTVLVSVYRMGSGKLPPTAVQGGGRRKAVTTFSLPFALGTGIIVTVLMVQYANSLKAGEPGA